MAEPILTDDLWDRIEPLLPKNQCRNWHVQHAGRRLSENCVATQVFESHRGTKLYSVRNIQRRTLKNLNRYYSYAANLKSE